MTTASVAAFVKKHGVVLVSARGSVPNVAEFVAGEAIRGSWWGHPQGKAIFRALSRITDSSDVLVCRLVAGKLTLVHRRLWPAVVRLAPRLPRAWLAQVTQEHTESGKHVNRTTPFPQWVPREAARSAAALDEDSAWAALGETTRNALEPARKPRARTHRKRVLVSRAPES